MKLGISEGEKNHGILWTMGNKLRVLEGMRVGGWAGLVKFIKEGTNWEELRWQRSRGPLFQPVP